MTQKEKNREANRRWRENNPDKVKENNKGRYNVVKFRAYCQSKKEKGELTPQQVYYRKNREAILQQKKEYRLNNLEAVRSRHNELKRIRNNKSEAYINENNTIKKDYPLSFVLEILKKNVKHSLWNKQINTWDDSDWKCFKLLIPN